MDVRSDQLPELIDSLLLLRKLPGNAQVIVPSPYHVVVDASHAVAAVRFKAKQQNPTVRVHLEELTASGILIAYAPTIIDEEVERRLDEFASLHGLSLDRLLGAWSELRRCIHVVTPSPANEGAWAALDARDRLDIPYCQLVQDVDADFLLTGDDDYSVAAIPVVDHDGAKVGLGALRQLARHKARELHSHTGLQATNLVVSVGAVGLIRGFIGLPWWIQAVPVVLGFATLLDPDKRSKAADVLADSLGPFAETYSKILNDQKVASVSAAEHQQRALEILPAPRKPTAPIAVVRFLIADGTPRRLVELKERLRKSGFDVQAPGFHSTLRLQLGQHQLLRQDRQRRWQVRSTWGR